MIDGVDVRTGHCLELLGRLTRTVSDFSMREEQAVAEFSRRSHLAKRDYRDAIHKTDTTLAAKIAAVESAAEEEAGRLQAIHDTRLSRVERAHAALLRMLPKRAQDTRGNLMAEVQMRQLRAEKAHTAGTKENDEAFTAAKAALVRMRKRIEETEDGARRALKGFPELAKALAGQNDGATDETPIDFIGDLEQRLARATGEIAKLRSLPLPRIFGAMPLPVILLAALATGAGVTAALGLSTAGCAAGGLTAVLLAVAAISGRRKGAAQGMEQAQATTAAVRDVRRAFGAACTAADARHATEAARLQEEYDRTFAELEQRWKHAEVIEDEITRAGEAKFGAQLPRLTEKLATSLHNALEALKARTAATITEMECHANAERGRSTALLEAALAKQQDEERTMWEQLDKEWRREATPLFDEAARLSAFAAEHFPGWSAQFVEKWKPAERFPVGTKLGAISFDLSTRADGRPSFTRLALPTAPQATLPVSLAFPEQGSLLIETRESCGGPVSGVLNNVILRILATTPPGKAAFTIIDPVGLGENFAGLMHLGDYEEALINRRIWTQQDQIDERLAELNEHIEKVIQMYLRNEYANITDYNAQAGSVAEKFHYLVVADFPSGFSETAAKRLQSIVVSGARCGVFTLIHRDQRQPLPEGFALDDLRKGAVCLLAENAGFTVGADPAASRASLALDAPPEPSVALALVHKIGRASVDSNRVEIPFSHIAPAPGEMWKGDTTTELRVAIGRTGATKLQYLAIGKGTRQHALFAGKTGSGKSTLFHVIITNLALTCSPDQVEFYLIDFKKGVEFKCYATHRLPHARVVAIESDREFALSVLQRVDDELKRRGDIFRKLGVQDLAGYKRAGGTEPMPRSLLLIDEFQEFFTEDDTIAQTASLLFDRIVRQGRAFGIHALLGSQTLGGAFTLARATMGQMVIRVALQCNEADAYLIMDESNSAPRLLSRPGEGIYNDSAGAVEGNSPFQVVWLGDDERDQWLDKVRALADERNDRHPAPVVFEGNAPADITENTLLAAALDAPPTAPPAIARCWLGAPNSIKGPTEVVFRRQSGSHLLIVGQREDVALTLITLSIVALAAQFPAGTARFIVLHSTVPGTPDAAELDRATRAIPHGLTLVAAHEIPDVMRGLSADMKSRAEGEGGHPVFLFIHGLHRFKKLRPEDEFSFSSGDAGATPASALSEIISEGSALGIHIVATVDTLNNVNRSLNRKALMEFETRVVFQMSANDSASLIDSPKAASLGLHRALLHNEQAGALETFRPYAAPDAAWWDDVTGRLARRAAAERRMPDDE